MGDAAGLDSVPYSRTFRYAIEAPREGYRVRISQRYRSTVSKDIATSLAMPYGISLENAGLGLLQGWHSTLNLDHSRDSSHTKFICGICKLFSMKLQSS